MPGGDRTGPLGTGQMTGRGAGFCAGFSVPGYANPGGGFGRGFQNRMVGGGFGRGFQNRTAGFGCRGRGRGFFPGYAPQNAPAPTAEEEKEMLQDQLKYLKEELNNVQTRINEIEEK